jgi:protein-S-isoprenylcysteine O-methyltransferase Ste14
MPPTAAVRSDIRPMRKAVLFGIILVIVGADAVTGSRWPADGLAYQCIRWIGIALMFASIGGRSWSRLYLSPGWHETSIIRVGPYSVSRNPLYGFMILGATGAAAQTSSIILALLTGGVVWLVFFLVARNEEDILESVHGEEYRNYMNTVPRFVPRLSLWRDVQIVQTRPLDTVKTFFDSSVLFLAIPVFALIEYFQSNGVLPILFTVY